MAPSRRHPQRAAWGALACLLTVASVAAAAATPARAATAAASRSAEPATAAPAATAPSAVGGAAESGGDATAQPPASPEDEVRAMLAAMAQIEADAARMVASFGDPAAAAGDAGLSADERLRQRLEARMRVLLDTREVAKAAADARRKLESGDAAGARALIVSTMQPFLERSQEVQTLAGYLPRRLAARRADARLRALLRGNGVESPDLPRLEQLDGLVAAREARDDFAMSAALELADLESLQAQAYDKAFQAALAAARARPAAARPWQSRGVRCPLAADSGAPGDAPRLDPTLSTPTSAYYPPAELEQQVEGKVAVSARIDPQGCVQAAAVLVGSGIAALDAAALRWMLEGAVYRRSVPRAGGELAENSVVVNFKAGD